jgi:hypothetical protein
MKVKELIEQLKQFDDELEIWVYDDGRMEEAVMADVEKNDLYGDTAYNVVLIR